MNRDPRFTFPDAPYTRVRRINGREYSAHGPTAELRSVARWQRIAAVLLREVRTLDATLTIGAVVLVVAMLSGWPAP